MQPKRVRIDEIELTDFDAEQHRISIRVVCGKGTYIRALARDLGRAMGSGAYLTDLRRTRVGDFTVDNCINFDHFCEWLAEQDVVMPKQEEKKHNRVEGKKPIG